MDLLTIIAANTPINEFGQNPNHSEFSPFIGFLMLFLWPLLIFIGYKFISYTMKKLEENGYLDEVNEEVSENNEGQTAN